VTTSEYSLNGSVAGLFSNGNIFGQNQTVRFNHSSYGHRLEMHFFPGATLNLSELVIQASDIATAVNASSLALNNLTAENITLFLPYSIGDGVYICPSVKKVSSVVDDCSGRVAFRGPFPQKADVNGRSVEVSIEGDYYRVDGLNGTGIGFNSASNMTIYDDVDLGYVRYASNNTFFFANWTNATTGTNVSGADMYCTFDINLGGSQNQTMNFNSSNGIYSWNLTVGLAGFYDWNVTCNGTIGAFGLLTVNDTVNILETPLEALPPGTGSLSNVGAATVTVGDPGNYTESVGGAGIAQGGNQTQFNITMNLSTSRWQGYFGHVSGRLAIGLDDTLFYTFGEEEAVVFALLASVNEEFDFSSSVNVSNSTMVDTAYQIDSNFSDSVNETYRTTRTLLSTQSKAANYTGYNFYNVVYSDETVYEMNAGSPHNYSWGAYISPDHDDFRGATNISDYQLLVPLNQTESDEDAGGYLVYYFFMAIE